MNRLDSAKIIFFPAPRGSAVAASFATLFVIGSCGVALWNIANGKSFLASGLAGVWPLLASGLWLILVSLLLWTEYSASGSVARSLLGLLGSFARRQFLACYSDRDNTQRLGRGFTCFGRRIVLDAIAIDQVKQLDWNTGQASARMGRDTSDWSIFLWYRLPENSRETVWHIASPGRKAQAYSLGHELVDFLRQAGPIRLVPGESDHVFVLAGAAKG